MPPLAAAALCDFCKETNSGPEYAAGPVGLQCLAQLQAFRGRFTYLIRETEFQGCNATELAFEHLRRLILVDEDVRSKWQADFARGEVACEKRGAVHLLAHGIWAFKVHGHSAATDLVFSEPLNAKDVARTARAIVLTEWKVVRDPKKMDERAEEARRETQEYVAGVLGDIEIKRTRYIVLVGEKQRVSPDDVVQRGICYHHIWLPVCPEVPSKRARRAT